jgi:hypothetical protein
MQYKFKFWTRHSSTGNVVTGADKKRRAEVVAEALSNQGRWLTHGRSIKLQDLKKLRLQIVDYSEDADLNDTITRYFTLLQMSLETNLYKIYEISTSQIYRSLNIALPQPAGGMPMVPNPLMVELVFEKCKTK